MLNHRRRLGRSHSVQLPQPFRHRPFPRSASTRPSLNRSQDENFETSETLSVKIFEDVKAQLDNRGVDTRPITAASMNSFLLKPHDTGPQREIFKRFTSTPITVPDREIAQIFRIKRSRNSDGLQKGSVCYYRSWSITKKELQIIIDGLKQDGFNFPQLESWKCQLKGMQEDERVWILYVGQTNSITPFQRCAKSTKWPKSRAILSNAFKLCHEAVDLDGSKNVRVFVLCDTDTSWLFEKGTSELLAKSNQRITDSYERFLITLFGSSSLLNTQAGGNRLSFTPSATDRSMLSTIGTTVLETLSRSVYDYPKSLQLSAPEYGKYFHRTSWQKQIFSTSNLTMRSKLLAKLSAAIV